jgi:hypothetical protein
LTVTVSGLLVTVFWLTRIWLRFYKLRYDDSSVNVLRVKGCGVRLTKYGLRINYNGLPIDGYGFWVTVLGQQFCGLRVTVIGLQFSSLRFYGYSVTGYGLRVKE